MHYSVQPRGQILVKGFGFLSISVKNIGKNIRTTLSGKHNQKLFDHTRQSATDPFKTTSKREILKTV